MIRERNWAGNLAYRADSLVRPTTVEQLQEHVAGAQRVKALGTRHSFTDAADSPSGVLVDVGLLESTVSVNHEESTATITGSMSYGEVAVALEAEGVALANMGSLPHISVAGGTATGTHGSGDSLRVLADQIAAIELVTADGSLCRIDRSDPDLGAVAIGLGAFGIITNLTLDVQPSYLMRQDLYHDISWDVAHESFDELMASAYSVNLHSKYNNPVIHTVISKSLVNTDEDGNPIITDAPETLLGGWLDSDDPEAGPQHTPRRGVPGPWHERLPHFWLHAEPSMGGDELQTDYMVAREDASAAMRALQAMGEAIDPHLWGTEIRSVAGDDLWMSPAYGRDSVSFGFTWRKHIDEVTALLEPVEAALAPFEPRPHWGKLFALQPEVLAERLPRYADFFGLVAEYDPYGKFANPFLDRLRV